MTMYNMVYDITIGKYKLGMIAGVEIKRSVELLSDTAIIHLPAIAYNKAFNSTNNTLTITEKSIKAGDRVVIQLGYNDTLYTEFAGYLEHIENENDQLHLYCEDAIYLYRKPLPNKEMINTNVKKIVSWVIEQLQLQHKLICNYDVTYDKFVVADCSGYDVLKKIQEELKPNIYIKDNTLHIHPQYTEIFGEAKYDFAFNIEKSNLRYKDATQRKLLVEIQGKDKNGKIIKVEEGTTGGDRLTMNISGISSTASLKKIAREVLLNKGGYTGYEGTFTAWLIPYCDAGYKVSIIDNDYEYKNGCYYVTQVETKFDDNGAERTITLGKKLE